MLGQVNNYIETSVVQSYVWDNADDRLKQKAINRALLILDLFVDTEQITVAVIAEQALWILKLDDTIERAEQGLKNIMVDGVMISIAEKDTTVAPLAFKLLGIPTTAKGLRRRNGAYSSYRANTGRWGNTVLKRGKDNE